MTPKSKDVTGHYGLGGRENERNYFRKAIETVQVKERRSISFQNVFDNDNITPMSFLQQKKNKKKTTLSL